MEEEQAPDLNISGIIQQLFEDLPKWLQDQPRVETPEDLAAITLPQVTSGAIGAIGSQLRAERARVLEQHERQRQARQDALEQALNQRQRLLQAYDEQRRNEALAETEGKFVVAGRIVDEGGAGLPDVRISAFEADRQYDDLLGETRTDMIGYYRLEYDESDFEGLPDEKPETYIEVLDAEGEQIYSPAKSFILKADEVEEIDVALEHADKIPRSQTLSGVVARLMDDQVENLEQRKQALNSRTSLRTADVPERGADTMQPDAPHDT
jgi:hypothetical protein